ncbi:MAG: 5-formyltetrahydrofolate cyclo-ligase [Culicoidibacterales bacterium]
MAYLFIGDSLVAGYPHQHSFVSEVERQLDEQCDRAAIPGQTTEELLVQFPQLLAKFQPEAVVVLIGTNDIAQHINYDLYERYLEQFVSLAHEANVELYFSEVPYFEAVAQPFFSQLNLEMLNRGVVQANIRLHRVATKYQLPVLPLSRHLTEYKQTRGLDFLTSDGIHYLAKYADIYAQVYAQKLDHYQRGETKAEIRERMIARRQTLNVSEAMNTSAQICQRVRELPCWQEAKVIGLYAPIQNEVNAMLLMQDHTKEFAFPKILGDGIMRFHSGDGDLAIGQYGIMEPINSKQVQPDLIVVPLVAFDWENDRLGYGNGYYDRYLQRFPTPTIGLAFNFQKVDDIPKQQQDIPLDLIVTQTHVYTPVKMEK